MKRCFSVAVCLFFSLNVFIPSFLRAETYMIYEEGVVIMVDEPESPGDNKTESVNKNDGVNVSEEKKSVADENKGAEDNKAESINENDGINVSEEKKSVADENKGVEDNKTESVSENKDENISEEKKTDADENNGAENNKTVSVNENEGGETFIYVGEEKKTVNDKYKDLGDDIVFIGDERKGHESTVEHNNSGNNQTVAVNKNETNNKKKIDAEGYKSSSSQNQESGVETQAKPRSQIQNTDSKTDDEQPAIAKKVQQYYNEFIENPKVASVLKFLAKRWEEIKAFVSELPGIKQYNNSIYTNENYKKEIKAFSGEYTPHLKNSDEVKKIKEGVKNY